MTKLKKETEDSLILMLGLGWIGDAPSGLVQRLEEIDDLCRKAGGRLVSRQIIAKEIKDWRSGS